MATARECVKKVITENIAGRKLVSIEKFEMLEKYLLEQGIGCDKHITLDKEKVDSSTFFDASILENKKSEYYILIPFEITENISKIMKEYEYELVKDYCYLQIMHKKIKGVTSYQDGFNNKCNYAPENLQIIFAGTNAKVFVGEEVKINGLVEITIYDDAEVYFGNKSIIEGVFRAEKNTKITIGNNVGGKFQAVTASANSNIVIGKDTTFTSKGNIIAVNGQVVIGEDCMIAANNTFWCGDGHGIYDVNTGNYLNGNENYIILKDHVWVGTASIILSKTIIEEGSIVGAGSLVKGEYPNNCIIAGNPASKKKNDIFWCRNLEGKVKESERKYFNKTSLKLENKKIDEDAIDEECSSNTYKVE